MPRYRQLFLPVVAVALAVGTVAVSGAAASAGPRVRPASLASHRHESLRARSSPATRVKFGRFKHPSPKPFDHDQFGHLRLPAGKFRNHPRNAQTQIASPANSAAAVRADPAPTINLLTGHVAPYDGWVPEEPTTAAVGNTVVYTSNDLISFSINGGHTFNSFDPRTMYRDDPAGGSDGDQDVIYIPQINEFAWLIQYFPKNGVNLDRLAVFPPSAVNDTGLTSWTYWNITAGMLPGTNTFLDFPDLALGDKYLYLTQNAYGTHADQTFIARIGLANLSRGLNLAAAPDSWRYVLGARFFGKVVQNTGSVAYWASNSSTSTMAASDWPESSTAWSGPVNVNVDSWPNTDYSSTTPDGRSWLNLYTGVVLASARLGNDLYFAWTAARGTGRLSWLKQPHVELVEMTTAFKFVSQRAIYNDNFAIAWPYLTSAPNLKGVPQLGFAFVWGGDKFYPNAGIGDLTTSPFVGDATVLSNANCACGRWGDFLAVRPDYALPGTAKTSQFVATGYGYDTPVSAPYDGYDDVYVTFTG